MEKVVTVNDLLVRLKQLSDSGYGEMKIKCGDCYLHADEISCSYVHDGELRMNGFLFNQPVSKKYQNLKMTFDWQLISFMEFNSGGLGSEGR